MDKIMDFEITRNMLIAALVINMLFNENTAQKYVGSAAILLGLFVLNGAEKRATQARRQMYDQERERARARLENQALQHQAEEFNNNLINAQKKKNLEDSLENPLLKKLQACFGEENVTAIENKMPSDYLCPVTSSTMHKPRYTKDCPASFEKSILMTLIKKNQPHPYTRAPFKEEDLRKNKEFEAKIHKYVNDLCEEKLKNPSASALTLSFWEKQDSHEKDISFKLA